MGVTVRALGHPTYAWATFAQNSSDATQAGASRARTGNASRSSSKALKPRGIPRTHGRHTCLPAQTSLAPLVMHGFPLLRALLHQESHTLSTGVTSGSPSRRICGYATSVQHDFLRLQPRRPCSFGTSRPSNGLKKGVALAGPCSFATSRPLEGWKVTIRFAKQSPKGHASSLYQSRSKRSPCSPTKDFP